MQRWFYANEELICEKIKTEKETETESSSKPSQSVDRTWRFCVTLKDRELLPNESVAVSGDCEGLGNWEFDSCVLMAPIHEDKPDIWHVYVNIPAERDVAYRYLITAIDPNKDQMIVRFFESHLKPRKVPAVSDKVVDICEDIFGLVENIQKVERGWLTTERVLQFMFFKAPFKLFQPELAKCTYHVKVTPYFRLSSHKCERINETEDMDLFVESFYEDTDNVSSEKVQNNDTEKKKHKKQMKCGKKIPSYTKLDFCDSKGIKPYIHQLEDNIFKKCEMNEETTRNNRDDVKLSTAFAFNEVANMFEHRSILQRQPRFGTRCGKDDLVTVHLTIGDFQNTVYLIELYLYNKNITKDEYPHLLGYRYIEPEDFEQYKHGYIEAPIVCASKHRQLGTMKIRFLIILPHENLKFDLAASYLRHWGKNGGALNVGHRGQGKTYTTNDNNIIYENTLYSINKAIQNGANMVEFDVHLTKDLVPVIYHDFNVHVSKKDRTLLQNFNNINIPINKYTYDELQSLKLPNVEPTQTSINNEVEKQVLFPSLSDILDIVDEKIGFDIEIKWPQQYTNCTWDEGVHPRIDPNIYVDCILETAVSKARKRRIVFSCFDADICTLLRFKQNIYPVMFLVKNELEVPYFDPRTKPISTTVNFAYAMELLGVVPHADVLLKSHSFIGRFCERDLIVFSYGAEKYEDIEQLKKDGVKAVIFDRMDEFTEAQRIHFYNQGGGSGGDELI